MKTTIVNRFVKTTALAAFIFIAFASSAFARPSDVSKYLMKQFQQQFQHADNVTWKTTDRFTSASFTLNGNSVSVFYNNQNNIIGISKIIAVQDLPKAAQKTLTTDYNAYHVVSAIDFTDENGDESYYIQLQNNGKEIILQSDGLGNMSNYQH